MRYNITPETQVYARVESVARSGMFRTISFYMIEGGELWNITGAIGEVTGHSRDRRTGGLRVRGCGMDMVWHTLYSYACARGWEESQRQRFAKYNLV